jgi:hypothetical protein
VIDQLTVFLDTNIMLHYPPLSQVDWCGLCNARSVRIAICLTVVHELDAKKSDARLAPRAERAIKEIREAYKGGQPLRDGVTLTIVNQELRVADFPTTLSPDSADDRIVHFAMQFRANNPGQSVAVMTEDFGMELRCEAHGVSVLRMDTSLRLENPTDELSRKYKQAVGELNAIKNRLPDLSILLASNGNAPNSDEPFRVELFPKWEAFEVPTELAKVRQKYPKRKVANQAMGLPALAMGSFVSEEDWGRYNRELDDFYFSSEMYLQHLNKWGEQNDRTFSFDLWVNNSGSTPAEDIDLFLMLPPVFRWVADVTTEAAKPLLRPALPEPPERPKSRLLGSLNYRFPHITPITEQFERILSERDRDTVEVLTQGEKGFCIHGKLRRVKHGQSQKVGSFLALFGSWDDIRPFEAEYKLSASELPDRVTGKIPFIVRAKPTQG